MTRAALALLALALVGCVPAPAPDAGPEPTDAGAPTPRDAGRTRDGGVDAGPSAPDAGFDDAGLVDAGRPDAGLDAGPGDGGTYPRPGFGALSGDCHVLAAELSSPDPALFLNAIDFGADRYDDPAERDLLTPGGVEILEDDNAGGSSLFSELFAYEVLARCEDAALLKTETEIGYVDAGTITDLLVEVASRRVGVSVTRAIAFPFEDPYSVAQAETLLTDKLAGVLESSALVHPDDAWVKQVLHVIAYAPGHAASIETAWLSLDASLRADTVVVVTVSNGDDLFLYSNE